MPRRADGSRRESHVSEKERERLVFPSLSFSLSLRACRKRRKTSFLFHCIHIFATTQNNGKTKKRGLESTKREKKKNSKRDLIKETRRRAGAGPAPCP